MSADNFRAPGDVVALRYLTTDGRIEMAWPCRVVTDTPDLLALWDEGRKAIDAILRKEHPCMKGWIDWVPDAAWTSVPQIPAEWSAVPVALWGKHFETYGRLGALRALRRARDASGDGD